VLGGCNRGSGGEKGPTSRVPAHTLTLPPSTPHRHPPPSRAGRRYFQWSPEHNQNSNQFNVKAGDVLHGTITYRADTNSYDVAQTDVTSGATVTMNIPIQKKNGERGAAKEGGGAGLCTLALLHAHTRASPRTRVLTPRRRLVQELHRALLCVRFPQGAAAQRCLIAGSRASHRDVPPVHFVPRATAPRSYEKVAPCNDYPPDGAVEFYGISVVSPAVRVRRRRCAEAPSARRRSPPLAPRTPRARCSSTTART
jgi:hypothetical protein